MRTYYFLFIAALVALTNNVKAARILGLFPHTGKSHQMVFEPLLHELTERGHHVTVVSFFPTKDPPSNYTDVSLEGISQIGLETIDLTYYEHPNKLIKLLGVDHIVRQIIDFSPLGEMALNVCRKLVDWPGLTEALKKKYDVILVENFNSDCMLGLIHVYRIKAPIVALLSSNLMPWSAERVGLLQNPSYVPIISTSFTEQMTFYQRLENTFMQTYFKLWFRYRIQLKEQEIIEKHYGRKITDLQELGKNTSLMLINTFHSFHGIRPLVPAVVEVGGMHLDSSKKIIPEFIERFINESEHGVLLFSFGSLIKTSTMPKYKEEILVNALSKLKQRVIWKYEDSDDEGTITGNILRVKWLPQYQLLQHNKVLAFLAHGGLLGMTEAIAAGKPMLIMPFYGDQPNNAAAAEAAGFAKVISYFELNEKTLLEALQKTLSAEMRINARRASKIWLDRESKPLDTAVYWVERVIRWGSKAPLHSTAAKDLNFFQYSCLDVAAAFILIVITSILILKSLSSVIIGYITSKEEKKKIT